MAEGFVAPGQGPFERVSRYEHRLEVSADRALRQLRQLRKDRGPDWLPPDEVHEIKDDDSPDVGVRTSVRMSDAPKAPVQNEPISEPTPASPDADNSCEQRACNIEPVAPTKLPAPLRGLGVPPEPSAQTAPPERSSEAPNPRNHRERR